MKKITLLLLISSFLTLSAQEVIQSDKHIVSFRFGYSIPVSSSQIGSPRSEIGKTFKETLPDGTIISEKNSYGSRGAGINLSLGYDYMITENISVGIDFSYLHTLGITDAYHIIKNNKDEILYDAKQTSYTSMFRATPMVGVYANKNLLIRPYAKFGLLIPFAGATYAKLDIIDETGMAFEGLMPVIDPELYNEVVAIRLSTGLDVPIPTESHIEASTLGAFSLGFDARLGAEYNILDHLNIFAELNMQMLTIKSNKTTITKFTSGTDENTKGLAKLLGLEVKDYNLEDIPEFLRVTQYVEEINTESNTLSSSNYNRDAESNQLNFRNNYNGFGFILGVKYGF